MVCVGFVWGTKVRLQTDPAAESFYGVSPCNSMGNNPISNIDPNGDEIIGAVIGAVVGGVVNGIIHRNREGGFWQGFAIGAVAGFVGGLTFNPQAATLSAAFVSGAISGGVGDGVLQIMNKIAYDDPLSGKQLIGSMLVGGVFAAGGQYLKNAKELKKAPIDDFLEEIDFSKISAGETYGKFDEGGKYFFNESGGYTRYFDDVAEFNKYLVNRGANIAQASLFPNALNPKNYQLLTKPIIFRKIGISTGLGETTFQIGLRYKPTNFMIRLERHSVNLVGGGRTYWTHINTLPVTKLNHFGLNPFKWGKIKF